MVALYSNSTGMLAIALKLAITPASTTATTTTYNIQNFARNNSATFDPEGVFYLVFRYPDPGFTGATGAVGATGATGSSGPTGAAAPTMGLGSLKNTAGQSISSGTPTTVTLGSTNIAATNGDITLNTGSSTITINTPGVYLVVGAIHYGSSPNPGEYQLSIRQNSTDVYTNSFSVGAPGALGTVGTDISQNVTTLLSFAATDTVSLRVTTASAVTLTGTGTQFAYLSVSRLS